MRISGGYAWISAMAEIKGVLVKFEEDALVDVDRVRGRVPRTVWIRDLCAAAVLAHDGLAVAEHELVREVARGAAESTEIVVEGDSSLDRAMDARARMERASRLSQGHGR